MGLQLAELSIQVYALNLLHLGLWYLHWTIMMEAAVILKMKQDRKYGILMLMPHIFFMKIFMKKLRLESKKLFS